MNVFTLVRQAYQIVLISNVSPDVLIYISFNRFSVNTLEKVLWFLLSMNKYCTLQFSISSMLWGAIIFYWNTVGIVLSKQQTKSSALGFPIFTFQRWTLHDAVSGSAGLRLSGSAGLTSITPTAKHAVFTRGLLVTVIPHLDASGARPPARGKGWDTILPFHIPGFHHLSHGSLHLFPCPTCMLTGWY